MKVFLGGTTNNTNWREQFEKELKIDYFNPVVDDWNDEAYQRELKEREICDYTLYVITPKMKGVYSIAEAVDDSNKRPDGTLFCYITIDDDFEFDEHQIKSLNAVKSMVENNGGLVFDTIDEVIAFLNDEF